jgi:O-antigen ligase
LWGIAQPLSIAGANIAIVLILTVIFKARLLDGKRRSLKGLALEKPLWTYILVGIISSAVMSGFKNGTGPLERNFQLLADYYIFSIAFGFSSGLQPFYFWTVGFSIAACLGLGEFGLWQFFQTAAARFNEKISSSHLWSALYATNRAHGTIHPVTFGELMSMAGLGILAFRIIARRKGEKEKPWTILAGILILAALALSGTRGAWMGFVVGLLVLAATEFRLARIELFAALIVIIPQFFFGPRFSQLAGGALSEKETSFKIHLALWKAAWKMFLDHPILGVGPGRFGAFFGKYHAIPFGGQPTWGNAHNLYLQTIAERGALGFCALLFLLGTMVFQAFKTYRRDRSFLSLWFLAWIAALLFMSLTESAFQVAMIWMPTIALYGWMESKSRVNGGKQ